ncbi:hypothetical protein BDA96_04G225600 [Sorghum bicolor]|uniref:Uncharacterized protein n=2 Tax=Sorghum bicolor TaxID=4558 RepID=A0A194YQZ6_SORBI|nr:hypothetical protein BDA96_04G225600 [Sorghum bicolor]KXG30617.1 hypothetical protein SORBI_3004G211800 [Sorghum bicolor]
MSTKMPSPNHHSCCFLPVCCPSFSFAIANDSSSSPPAAAASTGCLWMTWWNRKRLKPRPSCQRCGAAVL